MATTHAEVERKYSSDGDAPLDLDAALGALAELSVAGEVATSDLDATYFDTPDLGLLARRITLRRRTGGSDEGWHLKLPVAGDERREVRAPLGRATRTPPKELLDEIRAYLRGRPVGPVAVVRTERTERQLHDSDGTPIAVVAADRVRAERLVGTATSTSEWSEVEVELVRGEPRDLEVVERALLAAGLRRSQWASKLARALGEAAPDPMPRPYEPFGKRASAGDVVRAHLAEQIGELLARDAGARVDAPDAVHKMRVATRRLRSALATFRPLFDTKATESVRAELKWLGAELGHVRDAEVQRAGLLELLEEQPARHVVGPVRRRIDTETRARHRDARRELALVLDGDRYRRLLAALDRLIRDLSWSEAADRRARGELRRLTAKSVRRFDKAARRAKRAQRGGSAEELDTALHEVRKAAKRARYAAEVAAVVEGKAATRLAHRLEGVQEVLGRHQDAVTARVLLRDLATVADAAGENAFTYGVLHGAEHERGRIARGRYAAALRRATRRKVRTWLD